MINNSNIVRELEKNYKIAATEYIDQEINILHALTQKNNIPINIREGGLINLALITLLLLVLIIFAINAILFEQTFLMNIFLFCSLLIIWKANHIYQRIGVTILTLTEHGIQLPICDSIIPWEQIEHFYINQTNKLIFNFHLKSDYKLKTTSHSHLIKINYDAEKNLIQAIMLDMNAKRHTDYYRQLIMEYWDSGIARLRLQELEEETREI